EAQGEAASGDGERLEPPEALQRRLPGPAPHVALVRSAADEPDAVAAAARQGAHLRHGVLHGAVVAAARRRPPTGAPPRLNGSARGPELRRPPEVLHDQHHAAARPAADLHRAPELHEQLLRLVPGEAAEPGHAKAHHPRAAQGLAALDLLDGRLHRRLGRRRALGDDHDASLAPGGQAVQDGRDVLVARSAERWWLGLFTWSRTARARVLRRGGGGAGGGGGGSRTVCLNRRHYGLLDVGLDLGAGEAGLAHDAAHAGVVEDGDDELLQLNLDGEHGLLLLLRVHGAPALVGLRALEGGDERVGEGRRTWPPCPPRSGDAEVGRRFSATLKQSSRALHCSGCECDRRHAARSSPVDGGGGGTVAAAAAACWCSMALATCSGVTCAFPRRRARLTACFTTTAASGASACCTVQPPALILSLADQAKLVGSLDLTCRDLGAEEDEYEGCDGTMPASPEQSAPQMEIPFAPCLLAKCAKNMTIR
ncbi:LOW QUALITY PROTEIN: hypothetical protein U9M48_023215, partial [Paspalum notatum var. saurae]